MGYTIYHIDTKRSVGWKETERGAKISLAAWNRRSGADNYAILDDRTFNRLYNQKVAVKNLLSGREVYINQQDVGGCCDPSTESYWSM